MFLRHAKHAAIIVVCCLVIAMATFSYESGTKYFKKSLDEDVKHQLLTLLKEVPTAAHARIGFVGLTTSYKPGQLPIYSFNMEFAENNKGFEKRTVAKNLPLSEFSDMIPVIESMTCTFEEKSNLQNAEVVARMTLYHIEAVMICPVRLYKTNETGVSLLSWDDDQPLTAKEDVPKDLQLLKEASDRISTLLINKCKFW
jgi:hypothetical protein